MSSRKRSFVHNYFKVGVGQEACNYTCNECKCSVKAKTGNTKNLRQHLQAKHKKQYEHLLGEEAAASNS